MLLRSPFLLLMVALTLQIVVVIIVVRHRHALYAAEELAAAPADEQTTIGAQVRADLSAAWERPLLGFGFLSLAIALPYSLLSSGIVFYLQAIDPAAATDAGWSSTITLVRTGASLLATFVIARVFLRDGEGVSRSSAPGLPFAPWAQRPFSLEARFRGFVPRRSRSRPRLNAARRSSVRDASG